MVDVLALVAAYSPSVVLAVILGVMVWRNSRNTTEILRHYASERDTMRSDHIGDQERSRQMIMDKDRVIHSLSTQIMQMSVRPVTPPVPLQQDDDELNGMLRDAAARDAHMAERQQRHGHAAPGDLAPATMSSAEYEHGDDT